jgi:site-specific DNA-methyltransferase (adenine-specific)
MRGHVESRYVDVGGKLKFNTGGNILTGSGKTEGDSGKPWKGSDPSAKNRHWAIPGYLALQMGEGFESLPILKKLDALYKAGLVEIKPGNEWPVPVKYLDEKDGQPIQDIWAFQPYTEGIVYGTDKGIDSDVQWLGPTDPERLGYPTQKPEGLLERIIRASTDEGDLVLDAYCGCGTTIALAEKLKRKWIGIDITYQSISLILKRLEDSYGKTILDTVELSGVPKDFESAVALTEKKEDKTRKEFEKWAVLTYTNNRAVIHEKKGGDRGIDGIAYIVDQKGKKIEHRTVRLSVKSSKVLTPAVIRELYGTVEREKAAAGVLITLYPMKNLRTEAKKYGN